MNILLGKSILKTSFGQKIYIDVDKRLNLNADLNMALIGISGSGKTRALKQLINQFKNEDNIHIVVITSTPSEYKHISDIDIESAEELNDSYEVRYRINHLVNVNSINKIKTVLILDDNHVFYKKELLRFIESNSLLSCVHNCILITSWTKVDYIPEPVLRSTSIFQLFRIPKSDIDKFSFFGFTPSKANIASKLKRGQRILNVDCNTILIEGE